MASTHSNQSDMFGSSKPPWARQSNGMLLAMSPRVFKSRDGARDPLGPGASSPRAFCTFTETFAQPTDCADPSWMSNVLPSRPGLLAASLLSPRRDKKLEQEPKPPKRWPAPAAPRGTFTITNFRTIGESRAYWDQMEQRRAAPFKELCDSLDGFMDGSARGLTPRSCHLLHH